MASKPGGEPRRGVGGAPGAVPLVRGRAQHERRVEKDGIETQFTERREQVAVAALDAAFGIVERGVYSRAAHGRAIDVHGYNAACMPRREYRAHAGTSAHVEYITIGAKSSVGNDAGEELPGAQD